MILFKAHNFQVSMEVGQKAFFSIDFLFYLKRVYVFIYLALTQFISQYLGTGSSLTCTRGGFPRGGACACTRVRWTISMTRYYFDWTLRIACVVRCCYGRVGWFDEIYLFIYTYSCNSRPIISTSTSRLIFPLIFY